MKRSSLIVQTALVSAAALACFGCDLGTHGAGAGANDDGGAAVSDAGASYVPDSGFASACGDCHGDETSPAPPTSLSGETSTSARGVGAHRNHLDPNPTWHEPVKCTDCHIVPDTNGAPGHLDGDGVAELTFGGRAITAGAAPEWNGTTCNNVYCHGATLTGGVLTTPTWTTVDGSQDACGNCHGFPPPAPHVQDSNCGNCHPTIQPGTNHFLDPNSHINGVLDLAVGEQACDSCHGSGGVSAPPKDLAGNTARTAQGVGAHRQHLGTSSSYREMSCTQCHVVPTAVGDSGHLDGDNKAEITFDSFNPVATYSSATQNCSNLYCHGNGWSRRGTIKFTSQTSLACNSCHSNSDQGSGDMSGEHGEHLGENIRCSECHGNVVNSSGVIINPNLHVDGQRSVTILSGGTYNAATKRCSNMACHENESW